MTKKILLDTNFMVAPFQLSVDIFEEIERIYPFAQVYTIHDAVQEAKSIEEGRYGKLVEKLLDVEDVDILETDGDGEVDDLLVDISDDFIVATNDRELKQRILDRGRPVMIIRSESHVEVLKGREQNL